MSETVILLQSLLKLNRAEQAYLVEDHNVKMICDGAWVGEDVPPGDVLPHLALPPPRLVRRRPLHLDGTLVLVVVADDEDLGPNSVGYSSTQNWALGDLPTSRHLVTRIFGCPNPFWAAKKSYGVLSLAVVDPALVLNQAALGAAPPELAGLVPIRQETMSANISPSCYSLLWISNLKYNDSLSDRLNAVWNPLYIF